MIDFLIWWMMVLILGIAFMPLTAKVFSRFRDGGWIFSKAIGIFISGYVMWILSCMHILKFTVKNCLLVALLCLAVNYLYFWRYKKKHSNSFRWNVKLILLEEVLFFVLFGVWTYLVCYDPAAYGTEKFMDYGFMTSMMRTEYLPPQDTWYSGEAINYYYGGQYLAAFLTKLSGISVGKGYNFMRTMISAMAFVLPFSVVYQLLYKLQLRHEQRVKKTVTVLGSALAGLAVAFCGNMHYVLYSLIPTILSWFTGNPVSYYYPNSTRYIGHNPEVAGDKTIHEFPSYSFVVGDLHAHMVNLIFVLVVVGLALSWALRVERKKKMEFKEALLQPEIWLIGFFTGMFRWTNYWDFPIYFVVGGCVVFFVNIRLYRKNAKRFWITTIAQAAEVLLIGFVASLPFTLTFDKIASQVKLTHSHSAIYQLIILWGLPFVIAISFVVSRILSYRKQTKEQEQKGSLLSFFAKMPVEDLFIFLMALCAMGLVLMPEVIYMEDIYTTAYRANTMFKLTYQAFTLFGLVMAYVLVRMLLLNKKKAKLCAGVGLGMLLLTAGYGFNAIHSRFGNVLDLNRFKGIDASIYVSESFNSDYEAVCWLNENISGQPVVLEANGDSYTGYERVSVATGLPTVLGWYVHQWLWRGDTDAINERAEDVKTIYTSTNKDLVKQMIQLYDVEYIYIGNLERQKYPELNDLLLQEIGEVVYSNGVDTYILKVQ